MGKMVRAMQFTTCLVVLCALLRTTRGAISQVILQEDTKSLAIQDSPRTIPLAEDHTYTIRCVGEWLNNGVAVSSSSSSIVYATTNGPESTLHFEPFRQNSVGNYTCQNAEGDTFILTIFSDDLVLIADRTLLGLELVHHGGNVPSLNVFGSGMPQPTDSNYTWFFNNSRISATDHSSAPGVLAVLNTGIGVLFNSDVTTAVEGIYRCELNTSAEFRNVSVRVVGQVAPSPEVLVQDPTSYSRDRLASNGSVTFLCRDPSAKPVPSLFWFVNGNMVNEMNSRFSISDGNSDRESLLTINPVFQEDNGSVIECRASNIVEDETRETPATFQPLIVLYPPRPPTNVVATAVSSCQVQLSWTPPSILPNITLPADFILIEARPVGVGGWVVIRSDVSPNDLSSTVQIENSLGMRNLSYEFRVRSGHPRGNSPASTADVETVQLYTGDLPSVVSLKASRLVSSPSSLSLSWSMNSSPCYQFSEHNVSCRPDPLSGDQSGTTVVTTGGTTTEVMVGNLITDQAYGCSVTSRVRDGAGNDFNLVSLSATVETFTYPNYPQAPPTPKPDSRLPSPTNLTVSFELSPDHSSISHYQVIVVRVRSERDLPSGSPDQLYPYNFTFVSDRVANNHSINKAVHTPYIAAEIAGEDLPSSFVIGDGRVTGPDKQYTNGHLLSRTKYSCFLRAFPKSSHIGQSGDKNGMRKLLQEGEEGDGRERERQYAIFMSSDFMDVQETGNSSSPKQGGFSLQTALPGIASGAAIVIGLLLFILVVLFCFLIWQCRRRRRKFTLQSSLSGSSSSSASFTSKDSLDAIREPPTPDLCRKSEKVELKSIQFSNLEEDEKELIPSGTIPVSMFREHVERFDQDRQLLFQREFDWIQANSPTYPSEGSSTQINEEKNRYSNITAFDRSRVFLKEVEGVEGSDYINANYIPGYRRTHEYISTQGPLEQTVVDFWRMVWEQNSATIVMLTNLVEVGKTKCSQYWPSSFKGEITCGDIIIKLDGVVELRDYILREFTVTYIPTSESHKVVQFHYTKWPDYGTPKLAAPLLNFLRAVNLSNPPDAGPIIIHCSAGVGRSGTVITIDYCLHQLKTDNVVDVRGFVSRMREHRNYMVQTELQYAFIHYAILEAMTYGDTSFPLSSFADSYNQLQQKNQDTGRTLLDEEYSRLGSIKTMSKRSTFVQRVKQKGPTNRSIHYPGHSSYSDGISPHEYHAHFIDTYSTPKLLIVSDGPEESNAAKFWQMVWDQDCAYVIMLTPYDGDYYKYWPEKGHHQTTYGNIKITVDEQNAEHYYTTRIITMSNVKIGITQKVTQYQFLGWTNQYLPPVPSFVSFICDVLKGVETLQKNQKALVHDQTSLGPSGIFCSLCLCIERLRMERMVDVFQAVQSVQLQRPNTIESLQQYAFTYDCIYEFIRTHAGL